MERQRQFPKDLPGNQSGNMTPGPFIKFGVSRWHFPTCSQNKEIPMSFKQLFIRHNAHATVVLLRDIEKLILRMIRGIPMLFMEWVPDLFRHFLDWFHRTIILWSCIAIGVARVAAVFALWIAIVFGPLIIWPGYITSLWMMITLIGAVWELRRRSKSVAKNPPPFDVPPAPTPDP